MRSHYRNRIAGNHIPRPLWWGLRYLITMKDSTAMVCRIIGTTNIGYEYVMTGLDWTRCITEHMDAKVEALTIEDVHTIAYHMVILKPELMAEKDETVSLFPSKATWRFNNVASLAYTSRFAGYPCLRNIRQLYDTEKLGVAEHNNPVLLHDTPFPLSPIGLLWCQHYATPIQVERIVVENEVKAKIHYAGILDHNPTMTRAEFVLHDMCRSARLRYTIRLWVYANMCRGSITKTMKAIQTKKAELKVDEKGYTQFMRKDAWLYTGQSSWNSKDRNVEEDWKCAFYGYFTKAQRVNLMMLLTSQLSKYLDHDDYDINGVSEKTFNDSLFQTLPKKQRSSFNDFMLVNSFKKYTNAHRWSLTGGKTNMITLQFARDSGHSVPASTTLEIFNDQHKYDPKLVKFVEDQHNGTWEKQGTRMCATIVTRCILDRQNYYKICPSLKGPLHCGQRVIAAALQLKFEATEEHLNRLINMPAFKGLGADTHADEINNALKSVEVRQWLISASGMYCEMSLGDKISGDTNVREWLRSKLPEGCLAVAYPIDFSGAQRHCMLMFKPFRCGNVLLWNPSDAVEKDALLAIQSTKNETCLRIQGYVAVRPIHFVAVTKNKRMCRNGRRKRNKYRALATKRAKENFRGPCRQQDV